MKVACMLARPRRAPTGACGTWHAAAARSRAAVHSQNWQDTRVIRADSNSHAHAQEEHYSSGVGERSALQCWAGLLVAS